MAKVIIANVILNELAVFGGFILLAVGVWLAFRYIDERWSFIPRKQQRSGFCERF